MRENALPSHGGYPAVDALRRTYEDADLARAVLAYRFFYPTVSGMALWKGSAKAGLPRTTSSLNRGTVQRSTSKASPRNSALGCRRR